MKRAVVGMVCPVSEVNLAFPAGQERVPTQLHVASDACKSSGQTEGHRIQNDRAEAS